MTRRAYLIGGSYLKKLDGVRADIDAWKEFLQSSVGGSWDEGEIVDLSEETLVSIKGELAFGRLFDYTLLCFAGHGRATLDSDGYSTTIMSICSDPFIPLTLLFRRNVQQRRGLPLPQDYSSRCQCL